MRKRLIQIFGFLISTLGWLFVSCTMAMDYWRIVSIGGQGGSWIIKAAWYWSNLWRDCFTDTTAVTNCRDYDVLWSVTPYVQAVRGLLMIGMSMGFFGAIFCFVGMECTYIGGSEKTNDKMLLVGAIFHFFGGLSDITAYCVYINRVARVTFARSVERGVLRYGIGTPIFLGLVGSFFIILGAVLYTVTVYRVIFPKRVVYAIAPRTYMAPRANSRVYYGKPYSAYYGLSRQSRLSKGSSITTSSQISRISQISDKQTSERDAFV
ncbi:claudin-10-like [Chanos chanos]|uniref:Claudin-10-like n=1 Tax=Chanos chanos TaxID=29144 RepID=A0A6J2WJ94_CHACN|nr:claudin-10-like [Chanos chanos]